MMKRLILFVSLVAMLVANNPGQALAQSDYCIVYHWTIQGREPSIMRIFCQANQKYRIEDEAVIEGGINGIKTTRKSLAIAIKRFDQNTTWSIDTAEKKAYSLQLTEKEKLYWSSFPRLNKETIVRMQKIGEEVVRTYPCNIYYVENLKTKYWLATDSDLILKMATGTGQSQTILEAKELKFEKQPDNLFEIPAGYQVVNTVIATAEELQKAPAATLTTIADAVLTKEIESVVLSDSANGPRKLTNNEIDLLKDIIKNSTELTEISNQETPDFSNGFATFIVTWNTKEACNLWYEKNSGYCYLYKVNVHLKEEEVHQFDGQWKQKYLMGTYRFRPGKEINLIIR